MRRKADPAASSPNSNAPKRGGDELRCELERLGLAPDQAGPLADQLERLAAALPAREYRALFDGVLLAQRAKGRGTRASSSELQHLLQDFAAELKKVDEGLQLLASYLVRIRDQTVGDGRSLLH